MVEVRHNSTYKTRYLHLNGFGKGIRKGVRVRQGQIIGFVGSTGLASGPHLHFEFYENGRYRDPLGRRFPRADPLHKKHMPTFLVRVEEMMNLLERESPVAATIRHPAAR